MKMDEIQHRVGEWQTRTFKQPTNLGITAHLLSEAADLYMAAGGKSDEALQIVVTAQRKGADSLAEEAADVTILAFALAAHNGFSLEAELSANMVRNVARERGAPTGFGTIEHKEDYDGN